MIALLLTLADAPATLPMPAFLSGCWMEQKAERWTEECWTIARDGQMMGSARTGKDQKIDHWEWMRIERDEKGNPTFYASPKGVPASAFPAIRATATEIEWQNAAHDYPQRIVYRRTDQGIDAEISLIDGSEPNRWTYRRPGSAPKPK